jgi:5'(3')-deoxyribonucleotidase
MDGVIVEFNHRVVDHLNRRGYPVASFDAIHAFEYEHVFGNTWGMIAFDYINRDEIYEGLEPEPDALDVLADLRRYYEVLVVTSPLTGHVRGKMKWLWKHGFKHRDVIMTGRKEAVRGDLLIDDAVKNIKRWPGPAIVYDRPWNQSGLPLMHRAHNWQEVYTLSRHILENR